MSLKLPEAGPAEGRVTLKVKLSEADQRQEPVRLYLYPCGPKIAGTLLLLHFSDS